MKPDDRDDGAALMVIFLFMLFVVIVLVGAGTALFVSRSGGM